ncbi:MAG: DUF1449 family protein [Flavihumibacter sp.]
MSELAKLLFHPLSNAIMTVLTGITALYWIITLLAGNIFGDTDLHVHTDIDVHTDTDLDADGDFDASDGGKPFMQQALEYINIGKVPFMVVYSTFKFIAWIVTLASSVLLGLASWGWKSVFVLAPVFLLAYFITRFATKPLVKLYDAMGYNGEEAHELLGRVARMRSTIEGQKIGGAELVIKTDVIRVNVQSKTGELLAYGSDVMIAGESADKKYYLVIKDINLESI